MTLLVALGLPTPKAPIATAPEAADTRLPADPGRAHASEGELPRANDASRADGDDTATGSGTPPIAPPLTPPKTGTPPTAPTATAGGGKGAAPDDKNLKAFQTARAAVQKLLDGLAAHAAKDRIVDERNAIGAKITEADNHAAAKDWPAATKSLADAKALHPAAKKLADDWTAYLRERADAEMLAYAFGSADFNARAYVTPKLNAADAIAKGPPANFAGAKAELKKIFDALKPLIAGWLADARKKLDGIEKTAKETQAFAKTQIAEGKGHLVAGEKHLAAGEWAQAVQRNNAAMRVLGPALRMCERRGKYDTQRAATVAAIAKLQAVPVLKTRAAALDLKLKEADKLAAVDTLKIEAGAAALVALAAEAGRWKALEPTLVAHGTERVAAEKALADLDKHPAAAKVATQREAARTRLLGAKNVAVVADGMPDPAAAWGGVLADVRRAQADLNAAKALADSLGTVAAAETAAAGSANKATLKVAIDRLVADGQAAEKAPHADAGKEGFGLFDVQSKAALDAHAKGDMAGAAKSLAEAAASLTAAKAAQAGRAQFAGALPELEAALKALKDSPRAPKLGPAIAPVEKALADAKKADAASDAAGAMTALRRGLDAVPAAKKADADREAFDQRALALKPRIDALANPEKGALTTLASDAEKKADAIDFADAAKKQDAIEVRLEKARLTGLMSAGTPDAAQITDAAKKMAAKGGAADVDKLIHDIPDGGDMRLMNALAEGRYGVKFSSKAPMAGGDPVKAMRQVCDMFATIPQDIVDNPSITGVEWEDAVGSAGGSHSYDDAKVRMLGRPVIKQKFGANLVQDGQPQLPAVDPKCQPKDTNEVEYLAFAAAHEVAHGIDDARGFMARNGHLEKYGGWTTYGASVQPIADAIAGDPRFAAFCKTGAQKQWVVDRLLGKPVAEPVPADVPETNALAEIKKWIAMATAGNVYRRHGDAGYLKIGDHVYHEAYTRVWVRYLYAARSKGLTGYQFRAPGEWFAELYAGYRAKKLQDDHPAMEWLTKL